MPGRRPDGTRTAVQSRRRIIAELGTALPPETNAWFAFATWQRAVPGRAVLASTQVEYSLLSRQVEHEVLPACAALGLGVLPWSPLGRGVLTGKYRTGTPSDSRAASRHFASFVGTYLTERSAGIVEALDDVSGADL